jgi:predicted kinase
MTGLPGTGKTFASKKLEASLAYYDHIRFKEAEMHTCFDYYSPENDECVLYEFFLRIECVLDEARGVIFDSPAIHSKTRREVYDIGKEYGVDVIVVECVCDEDKAKERLAGLEETVDGYIRPHPTNEDYISMASAWEPVSADFSKNGHDDHPHVSWVRYDSESNKVENLRVSDSSARIIDDITRVITSDKNADKKKDDGFMRNCSNALHR